MTKLSPQQLRPMCDPGLFPFKSTEELAPLVGTIGQERALSALDFGIGSSAEGYNLFVTGPAGTGRHSTVEALVKQAAAQKPVPPDWCYVHNFHEPDRPMAIQMRPGEARQFSSDMDELIQAALEEIPRAFESEDYERRKNSIVTDYQDKRGAIISDLRKTAKEAGFSVEFTPAGIISFPVVEGKPLRHEQFDQLPEEARERVEKDTSNLQEEINHVLATLRALEKEAKERLAELDHQVAEFAIGHLIEDLRERYKHNSEVLDYLTEVAADIITNLDAFKSDGKKPEMILGLQPGMERETGLERYRVNVFTDNSQTEGAPVVMETNPTYYNLFGRVEYEARLGAMTTDFTMIKAGSYHKADGGFLILNALDVLLNFMTWDALKRCLRTGEAKIENIGEQFRVIPAATLTPEPIPAKPKVIMIGSPFIYYLLYHLDEDFRKLFKVKADFAARMDKTDEHLLKYAAFIASRCSRDGNVKHFDPTGVAAIVDYGTRLSQDQKKLSTKFIDIEDLVSEASYWADRAGADLVGSEHVEKAMKEKIYRSNLLEERVQELIDSGHIMIDTSGAKVGQVNGLSVYDLGDYAFAKPTRITCATYASDAGVVNVEREAKLSGKIHNKSVVILAGYMAEKYAGELPFTLGANISFEQTYEEIEGDSASCAELFALLSSLADVPLNQEIAVTGSVNQKGQTQAIGAVNEKIEGYFEVCSRQGLTGTQGVIIPAANVSNLMLKEDVARAVAEGKFNVWSIENIDEGMELLTGMTAGERDASGRFPENTINRRVSDKLDLYARALTEGRGHRRAA